MLAAGADQYVLKTGRVRPLLEALNNFYDRLGAPADNDPVQRDGDGSSTTLR